MPIIFRCPKCGTKLSVSRKQAGLVATCPGCVQRITVPTLEGEKEQVAEDLTPPPQEEQSAKKFKLKKRDFPVDELDMTPMIDVTFLLLIFFMITASFAVQKSLQTSPPEPEDEGVSQNVNQLDVEEESVVVDIDAENNLRVDDVPISSVNELVDILTAKRTNENKKDLLIEVHELAKHGMVVAVTDAGLDADMQHIRRATRKDED